PEQLHRRTIREDFARGLRQLRGEPEAQAPAAPVLPQSERCYCGGPWLFVGGRRICGLGRHDD
ncbi:hypothetical protein, partial [Myxococcus llanfairpwllgwyngyllgogerychwyrndrobwllllantysiliogogogochensis]|uniref:hypothetical protein n=1 Tax=Myxococcus llanfairpwllgwyngyllgogerychwyrndrobwllllantysiliogogogochensis TaxID=2590453 RepID=UPI0015F0B6D7